MSEPAETEEAVKEEVLRSSGVEVEVELEVESEVPRAKQLRLLPVPKPLTGRLGRAFFLSIPKLPGIYRMYDEDGVLLYVGKSVCLRDRLNSYRHVHPDRDSRKTVRLVHRVRRIEWSVCATHNEALLMENEPLRTLRPPFNRMNTWPNACLYVGLGMGEASLELRVGRERDVGLEWFGAFKPMCLAAHAAMVRCAYAVLKQPRAVTDLPLGFVSGRMRRSWKLETTDRSRLTAFGDGLRRYLAGEDDRVVTEMGVELEAWRRGGGLAQSLVEADLELLAHFYRTGPMRVRRMLESASISNGDRVVRPEELLDYLALERPGAPAQALEIGDGREEPGKVSLDPH